MAVIMISWKLTDCDSNPQRKQRTPVYKDSNRVISKVPATILEHKVITSSDDVHSLFEPMANCSISHMDLGKSKTSLDESPVNSDADIYHQQSSQHLSGLANFHDNHASFSNAQEQSMPPLEIESDSKEFQAALSLLLNEKQPQESGGDDPELNTTHIGHETTVLISYQRRGKSTHETFMRELYALFTVVERVSVPNLDYPQDVFYLYSCRR